MNIFTPLVFLWDHLFYYPIINLVIFIYKYLGHNLGIAIIIVTVLVRLILWPFMKSQIMAMKNMQQLKPKIEALKEKYKDDKKGFQEQQLRLYKDSGVNPAGSCLPLLIQLPFIYALYNVIRSASSSSSQAIFNKYVYLHSLQLPTTGHFNTSFLGIDLAKYAFGIGFHNILLVLPYIILALVVGITQFGASKVSLPETIAQETEAIEIIEESDSKRGKKKKTVAKNSAIVEHEIKPVKQDALDPESFSKNLSTQMLYLFPLILVYISLGGAGSVPAGLSIYWIVQSLCIIIQTLILQGKLPWKTKK